MDVRNKPDVWCQSTGALVVTLAPSDGESQYVHLISTEVVAMGITSSA